ncbi:unnamed protein product [Rotaria sordida]|uniref:Fibronectin type-III domain-containing protein n=1 Tax=Rotaria sordida TaxID=392033 RepID=A0A815EQK9_9BILA|nr:unnamed protein product [Rotaria sordida]
MSTTILPDIYRHTARKSTISRNVKISSNNLPLYNSTSIVDNNNIKEEKIIFDQIQSDYKFEKNIQQQKQSFLILPDNEIEQMIIEQTNEEIIKDILEQIQKQISNDYLNQTNGIQIISTDIHTCIDSLLNHFDTNNNESISTINDVQMEDITRSLTEQTSMESDQQSSTLSQFDIIEPEESISTSHAHLCTCQCHQTTSNSVIINPTNEYILFERILQQTRQEEQEKQILNNNNRLLQTLKHQHQELMNFYQKQTNINKIDREQQTIHIDQQDSQIQTDSTTIQQQQNSKSNVYVYVNGINPVPTPKIFPTTNPRPFNTFLTPIRTTGPSLQQLIPCLTTTNTASTITLTNKISIIKKITSIPIINSHPPPPPPPLPPPPLVTSSLSSTSHDIVDLTEEDDDHTNKISTEKISSTAPVRILFSFDIEILCDKLKKDIQQYLNDLLPPLVTSSLSSTSHDIVDLTEEDDDHTNKISTEKISSTAPEQNPISAPTTIRNQPTNRPIRPNTTIPLGQAFLSRPLPEHNSCDNTIARPQLSITHDNTIVRLTWNLPSTPMESIQNYEIYAYKQNVTTTSSDWKKIGTVKSMRLPMAVTLKEFQCNCHYAFAVRAISINNNTGPFCEPKTIFTGNIPIEPLNTSQILNLSL